MSSSDSQQTALNFGTELDQVAGTNTLAEWAPEKWAVAPDWKNLVDGFFASSAGAKLADFLRNRLLDGATIFPDQPLRALNLTPLSQVKVVILGQDPYHGLGQAQGLAFSVRPGCKLPPSLRNIFKEIRRDQPLATSTTPFLTDGSLTPWAKQGVLLLNSCLTVEGSKPASHSGQGWETLTRTVLQEVSSQSQPVVFMLWGAHAQAMRPLIDSVVCGSTHLVLTANHPSPLSANRPPLPFLGCGHFKLANDFLIQQKSSPIEWQLDSLNTN